MQRARSESSRRGPTAAESAVTYMVRSVARRMGDTYKRCMKAFVYQKLHVGERSFPGSPSNLTAWNPFDGHTFRLGPGRDVTFGEIRFEHDVVALLGRIQGSL